MADQELNIRISLKDELTSKLSGVTKNMAELGGTITAIGRQMGSFGRQVTFLGGAITGVLSIAIKQASDHSRLLADRLDNLKATMEDVQEKIANALIPVIDRLSNIISYIYKIFIEIDKATFNMGIQFVAVTGIILLLTGVITALAGRMVILVGVIIRTIGALAGFAIANPYLTIIIGSIIILITLMMKFKIITDVILSTFQILFALLENGFNAIIIAIESGLSIILGWASKVMDVIAMIPGPFQDSAQSIADNIHLTIAALDESIAMEVKKIQGNTNTITGIFATGTGSWAKEFDKFKLKIDSVIDKVKGIGKASEETSKTSIQQQQKNTDGMVNSLNTLGSALQGYAAVNKDFARTAQIMAIALAVVNTAQGVTKAFADYTWPFSMIVAGIITAAGALQIATIAAQSFHFGGMIMTAHDGLAVDEVPIIAQTGEGILSRRGMSALGGASMLGALNSGLGLGGDQMNKSNNYKTYAEVHIHIEGATFLNDELPEKVMRNVTENVHRVLARGSYN